MCVTCVLAGVESFWEQEKLEERKMFEKGAESPASGRSPSRSFACPSHEQSEWGSAWVLRGSSRSTGPDGIPKGRTAEQ